MAWLAKLLKYLGLLVAAVLVVGVLLPAKATMSRQVDIKAPAATVFALLDGFQRFNEFSPWFQYDPQAQYAWSGPATGVGAKMSWQSENARVGRGSQEIIALEANKSVTTKLQFDAPGSSAAQWLLEPAGDATRVTWKLETDSGWNVIGRWFGVFIDRMVGADFELGLARLKQVAEADAAKPPAPAATIELLDDVAPLDVAYLALRSPLDVAKIGELLGQAYGRLGPFLQANGLSVAAPPGAITRSMTDKEWVFEAFMPLSGTPQALAKAQKIGGDIKFGKTPAGRSVKAVHVGPYEGMMATYEKIGAYLQANKLEARDSSWEQYISDPGKVPADQLVSYIFQPVK